MSISIREQRSKSTDQRFWEKAEKSPDPSGCWVWKSNTLKSGYGAFGWNRKSMRAHRMAWILTFGPIPDGALVCHRCDNRKCVNPDHLFIGTPKDNMDDMIRKGRGRWLKGEETPTAKLTQDQVREIRSLHSRGVRNCELVRRFGAHKNTISGIVNHRKWKHLPDPTLA